MENNFMLELINHTIKVKENENYFFISKIFKYYSY